MAVVLVTAPLAPTRPIDGPPPMRTVTHEIRLAATVPPGGLITGFLRNQQIYCSIICPLLAQTGSTAVTTTLQAPGAFLAALPADGLLRAIGVAAASVTGPTDAAMERAIAADAAIPAQRALNAFEVGVVGLLNIVPALAGGPSAVLAAIQRARQQTFDALNAPVVPNPPPTVAPHGVVEVAVVQAINIVGAVIFPAFNDVLAGAFQVPDSVARELASSGNPIRAVVAGAQRAVTVANAAVTVIAQSIVTAIRAVRAAATPAAAVKTVVKTAVSRAQLSTGASPASMPVAASHAKVSPSVASTVSSLPLSHKGGHRQLSPHGATRVTKPSRPALRAKR